jgi:hypothetical protein
MGRVWRLSVVVLVLTLAPMQARAECAWVLWQQATLTKEERTESRWLIIDSFETRDPCEARKEFHINARRDRGQQGGAVVEASGDYVTIRTGRTQEQFRTMCLPTGTDPRGPKGGGG